MRSRILSSVVLAAALASIPARSASAQDTSERGNEGRLTTPSSLHTEHQLLLEEVSRAMADQGAVGDAARVIERTLTPHLKHEEELVLQPLGLIRAVVHNQMPADIARVRASVEQIGNVIFRLKPAYDTPWPVSLLVVLILIGLSALVLERRVRGIEVVA